MWQKIPEERYNLLQILIFGQIPYTDNDKELL